MPRTSEPPTPAEDLQNLGDRATFHPGPLEQVGFALRELFGTVGFHLMLALVWVPLKLTGRLDAARNRRRKPEAQ